jgi:acetyltransferase-like isoleucine patch superfamily enzyme
MSMVRWMRWVIKHRAWTPYYIVRLWRYCWFRVRYPHVITEGFVFLGKRVRASVRRGYGRLIIGRWVHLGDGTRLFAHEGTLRIGDKAVFGSGVTVTCYLDVEIGGSTLVADWVYISDFDHVTTDLKQPIKDQGLVKSPVRVGHDCWLGIRSTVLRGSRIGAGVVVGAHSVVRGEVPDEMIVGGVPAKPLKDRREAYEADADRRAYLEGLARGAEADAERARRGGPDADEDGDGDEASDRAETSDRAESRAETSSRAGLSGRGEVAAVEVPEGPLEAP